MSPVDSLPDETLSYDDLRDNPTTRLPICLCLDTSYSMIGAPLDELNAGVRLFFETLAADRTMRLSCEVAVVNFGPTAQQLLDFRLTRSVDIPTLIADGQTLMGEAVNLALDMLERRKDAYKAEGVDYYQPWLVLITDGAPTDVYQPAAARAADLVQQARLTIMPVGVGPNARLDLLQEFSPKLPPARLHGLDFKTFFEWLKESSREIVKSQPGQAVKYPEITWRDPWQTGTA